MPDLLASLLVFAFVATFTPGGANLLAAASGAQFGYWRSVPLLTGMAFGLASLVAAAAAGLGALLQSAPALQLGMRAVGSAYLLWLAWQIGRSGAPNPKSREAAAPLGFLAGLLLLWVNPKAWSLALGSAAAYTELTNDPWQLALALGTIFGTGGILAVTAWCTGGFMLSKMLRTERQWRAVNLILGLLLAASIIPMWL